MGEAYRRHGRRYYPKLVAAVPFTPVPGPRVLALDATVRRALLEHAIEIVRRGAYSSVHILFPPDDEAALGEALGMIPRQGVQFHWENPGYRDFADFLAAFSHDKRKKVKQERRRLGEAGVTFERKQGREITGAEWAFFYQCYEGTYRAHHSTPYLTPGFFEEIGRTLADNVLLVVGSRGGRRLCAALDIYDEGTLWGRYRGTSEYVPALHFEACYYQAIEFCIEQRIARFEGGAQGLHKLARGLRPVATRSLHAVGDRAFAASDCRVLRARAGRRRALARRARVVVALSAKRTVGVLIYYTDHFVLPLPPDHRFPMRKYAALRERVAAVAGDLVRVPPAATDAELVRAHDTAYVAAACGGTLEPHVQRRIGFPWSPAMIERSRRSVGATIAACRSALDSGCGINLAGGTHHAHRDHGEGFCVFNDAAVAARAMQAEGRALRVLIVDLDVHQGDGSAEIFATDESVFTLSLHGRNNFPFRKQQSRLDVELDDGTGDRDYLAALDVTLRLALAHSRPELVIYLAGADPYRGDRLGRLALSKAGLAERDRRVLSALRAADIPVAIAMAGGYAEAIDDIVDIHFATVSLALEYFGEAGARLATPRSAA